jgi:hypothetical protein
MSLRQLTKEELAKLKAEMEAKWSVEGFATSARDHVGKLIDSGQIPDLALDAGVAYFGYKAAVNIHNLAVADEVASLQKQIKYQQTVIGPTDPKVLAALEARLVEIQTINPEEAFAGILVGLLSKRLALTMGGTPPVSQIAGLAGLSAIGLINAGPLAVYLNEILGVTDSLRIIEGWFGIKVR